MLRVRQAGVRLACHRSGGHALCSSLSRQHLSPSWREWQTLGSSGASGPLLASPYGFLVRSRRCTCTVAAAAQLELARHTRHQLHHQQHQHLAHLGSSTVTGNGEPKRALSTGGSTAHGGSSGAGGASSGSTGGGASSAPRSAGTEKQGEAGRGGLEHGAGEHPAHTSEAPKRRMQSNWTIPNALTAARMGFVPVLGYWITVGDYKLALAGLAVASASDWLDGYLARRLNQRTVLGGILDPLADKVMVATISVTLGVQGLLPLPLVALMFGRDSLLVGGAIVHRARTRPAGESFFNVENLDWEVKPSFISKANTALQFTTLWAAVAQGALAWPGEVALEGLCWATGAATLASGISYVVTSGIVARSRGRVAARIAQSKEVMRTKVKEKKEKLAERSGKLREGVKGVITKARSKPRH